LKSSHLLLVKIEIRFYELSSSHLILEFGIREEGRRSLKIGMHTIE